MTRFDPRTLRDPAFKQKFEVQLNRIKDIRETHSFIGYATNRDALDGLIGVYEENLFAYQSHFLQNKSELEDTRNRIHANQDNLLPVHYQQLLGMLPEMEQKLESFSYEINAQVTPLLKSLNDKASAYVQTFQQWNILSKKTKARLGEIRTQVWAENYQDFQFQFEDFDKKILTTGDLLESPDILNEAEVTKSIAAREEAFQSLTSSIKGKKALLRKVHAVENTFLSEKDFNALKKSLLGKKRLKALLAGIVVATLIGVLGYVGVMAPKWQLAAKEDQAWAETKQTDSWQGYQNYLTQYPEGNHTTRAQEAMYALDYAEINRLVLPDSQVIDYEGELNTGIPNGQGKATFIKGELLGATYEGSWELSEMQGHGTMKYPNKGTYVGEWQSGKRQGKGIHTYPDKSTYNGDWQNDSPHGKGTRSFADGSRYTGKWKSGKRSGMGTLKSPGQPTYSGNWSNNMRHGTGSLKWSDGSKFTGTWQSDKIEGPGVYISRLRHEDKGNWKGSLSTVSLFSTEGNLIKKGTWDNGLFIGD